MTHPDVDTLAELSAGLLDDEDAARVRDHVRACAACSQSLRTVEEMPRLLGGLPAAVMPEAVAAAIDRSLAGERPLASVRQLYARRRRARVLRVAAGVVVFAAAATGIGSLIGHLGSATSRKTSEHSAAEPAPAAGRAAGPKAPLPSGSLNAQRGSVDYNAASLPSLVHELVSRQVAAGRFEPNDVLPRPACALVNVAALKQLASASVIFDGQPATVVVLTDPAHPNTWIVRVLRAGCVPAYGVELPAS